MNRDYNYIALEYFDIACQRLAAYTTRSRFCR